MSTRAWPFCRLGAVGLPSLSGLVGVSLGKVSTPPKGGAWLEVYGGQGGKRSQGWREPVMGAVSVKVGKGRRGCFRLKEGREMVVRGTEQDPEVKIWGVHIPRGATPVSRCGSRCPSRCGERSAPAKGRRRAAGSSGDQITVFASTGSGALS